MKKFRFIVLALLSMTEMSSQERFFTFAGGWGGYAGIENDNGYTILGTSFQDNFQNQLQFDELSYGGVLIDGYSFLVDSMDATGTTNASKQLLQISAEEYLGVGSMSSISGAYGLVFRHNITQQTTEVVLANHDASTTQFYSIHAFTDTTYLVTAILSWGTANTRLYCIGYNDSIYWTEDFWWAGYQQLTLPHDLTVTPEGNILGLFTEYDLEGQNQFEDRARARLVKLDSSGNELWSAYPGNHEDYKIFPGGVIESNGEVTVCFTDPFYYDSTGEWQGNFENKVRFERYDADGTSLEVDSIVEPDYYGPLRLVNQFTRIADGDYLVAGYHHNGMAMMMKVQPDLDLQWNRRYTPYPYSENPLQESAMFNVIETSDGGFLCTGEYITYPGGVNHPNGFQSGFAMKLDSLGCLEEGCHVVGLTESEELDLKVYPNPNNGTFVIDGLLPSEDYVIAVINANGQIVQRSAVSDFNSSHTIDDLVAGVYQVHILGSSSGALSKQIVVIR